MTRPHVDPRGPLRQPRAIMWVPRVRPADCASAQSVIELPASPPAPPNVHHQNGSKAIYSRTLRAASHHLSRTPTAQCDKAVAAQPLRDADCATGTECLSYGTQSLSIPESHRDQTFCWFKDLTYVYRATSRLGALCSSVVAFDVLSTQHRP